MKRILTAVLLAASLPALAETAYVTDQLKITLRSGESTTHKVIRMLQSGTAVEVVSRNQDTGYSQVRLGDGTTGYVLSRMLEKERSARERLAEAEAQLQILQQEPGKLSSQLASLQEKYSALENDHTTLRAENDRLNRELDGLRRTAAEPVRIAQERDAAVERNRQLNDELASLRLHNQKLVDRTEQNWFMIGGGVVVIGIILGLILPRLRVKRRRSEWGDF